MPNSAPASSRSLRQLVLIGLLLAALLVLAGLLGFTLGAARARQPAAAHWPDLGVAPSYQGFANQLGQILPARPFAGRVQVVTYLFPYCTGACPLIALHLVRLEQALQLAHLQNRVQLVAFNVDPWHTGPAQAAAFQREYGWNPRDLHWQFLSGTPARTRQVVSDGFHINYAQVSFASEAADAAQLRAVGQYVPQPQVANPLAARVKPDYDIAHDNALALVGPHGHVRWISDDADSDSAARLLAHIQALLQR